MLVLHDIVTTKHGLAGSNLGNADLLCDVEGYLNANPGSVISADDGYRSILKLLPALEKTGSKLLAFVTPGYSDGSVLPYELLLSSMLQSRSTLRLSGTTIEVETLSEKNEAFARMHRTIKPLPPKARMSTTKMILSENGCEPRDFDTDIYLNLSEIRELSQHPCVEIGSHSMSHAFLPSLPLLLQIKEVVWSKRVIERAIGRRVTRFAYPYGGLNGRVRRLAKYAGYSEAFGTEAADDRPFSRKRIPLATIMA